MNELAAWVGRISDTTVYAVVRDGFPIGTEALEEEVTEIDPGLSLVDTFTAPEGFIPEGDDNDRITGPATVRVYTLPEENR